MAGFEERLKRLMVCNNNRHSTRSEGRQTKTMGFG